MIVAGEFGQNAFWAAMSEVMPVFILSAMRSYSSVICAMLGQHPDLYGMPELNLSVADDMRGVQAFYARRPHGLHGLLRAIAELRHGEQTEETIAAARAWLEERQDWSTARMLAWLEEQVAPRRLVDKSPVTVRSLDMIERLYRMRPDAKFLHLVRAPAAVCRSVDRFHADIDAATGSSLRQRVNPEQVWLRSNANVVAFKRSAPPGVCLTLQGESLLAEFAVYAVQVCEWLGIRNDQEALDAMQHPERSPFACIGPGNAEYGNDPNFLKNPQFKPRPIDVGATDAGFEGRHFMPRTLKMAREFGYA